MSVEKTEQPTPKKIRDARNKGQVCKSKEVNSTILILSLLALLFGCSDYYMERLGNLLLLPGPLINLPFKQALDLIADRMLLEIILLLIPIIAIASIAIIFAHLIQYGLLFSTDSIIPDIKKINPIEGAKKIFSTKSLIDFIKSIVKVALLSALVWITLQENIKTLVLLANCGTTCIPPVIGSMLLQLTLMSAVGFLIISAADYYLERYQHLKQLRMTKDEVKREYKEMEGSPEIKRQRRKFHQELQSSSIRADVKRSSLIVSNPTHIAIGIHYKQGETPLPVITLKYTDAMALQVRRIAEEEGIPVIERIPLARALYRDAIVDQYIPAEHIKITAEVLRWLMTQDKSA